MPDYEIDGLTVVKGIEKIQESSLFVGLSFDETRLLANICRPVFRKDSEIIIEENSIGQELYLVVKGEVRVFKGEAGNEKTLSILKPGEMFGEMSLIEDMLTSSSVVAIGDTQLLMIDKKDLEKLMAGNDQIAAKIYRSFCIVLSKRLREANQKLKEVSSDG
jgi:CRP-like cAMP-binding protein